MQGSKASHIRVQGQVKMGSKGKYNITPSTTSLSFPLFFPILCINNENITSCLSEKNSPSTRTFKT